MTRCEHLVITQNGLWVCQAPGGPQSAEPFEVEAKGCGGNLQKKCLDYQTYLEDVATGREEPPARYSMRGPIPRK